MKKLGIIGGLGPMATAYFMQILIEMTKADTDQEHIEMIIYNSPQIPDRTSYILGKSEESPLPYFVSIAEKLAQQEAEVLAIPCVTAHYFHKEVEMASNVPIINAVEETAKYLKSRGYQKVGIMATDGTVEKGIISHELEKYGIVSICPNAEQQKMVMQLIYGDVKSGHAVEWELFEQVAESLFTNGAEVIILGCTELSIIKKDRGIKEGYLDVLEVLARACVKECGVLKEEYQELLPEIKGGETDAE